MWVSLPPKAAAQKFPEANSPGGRRQEAAEEGAGCPVQIHSAQVKFYPVSYVKMEISPYLLIKITNPSQAVLTFWERMCEHVAILAGPVGV